MAEDRATDVGEALRGDRSGRPYPREMILAAILLVIADAPAPAGVVVERLRELGLDWGRSQPVWNCLHALMKSGLLRADRSVDSGGRSGRRLYELSPEGALVLKERISDLQALSWKLARWQEEYAALPSGSPVTVT